MRKNGIKIICIVFVMLMMANLPTYFSSNEPVKAGKAPRNVPPEVKPGDIMMMDFKPGYQPTPWEEFFYMRPGLSNDHAALYIGNNQFIHAGYYGVGDNYTKHFLSYYENFTFVRVKTANNDQRAFAVDYANFLNLLGLGPQIAYYPPWFCMKEANPSNWKRCGHKFYCMELVWACYYIQGIDIDRNGWQIDTPFLMSGVVGDDIILNTEVIEPYIWCFNFV